MTVVDFLTGAWAALWLAAWAAAGGDPWGGP